MVKLNKTAFDYAMEIIEDGKYVHDEKDAWSQHRPSAEQENLYIKEHGFRDYNRWFLGIDEDEDKDNKGRYKFPYGDFENVHRCAVLAAESRAGQYKYFDIQQAVAHLHGMLDAEK